MIYRTCILLNNNELGERIVQESRLSVQKVRFSVQKVRFSVQEYRKNVQKVRLAITSSIKPKKWFIFVSILIHFSRDNAYKR